MVFKLPMLSGSHAQKSAIVINAGTGRAVDYLGEIDIDPARVTLLLTHAFRDHGAGAEAFPNPGAVIYGNYWDGELYVDPISIFANRRRGNSYDNRWDRFGPITPVPIDAWLMDYETRRICGFDWQVISTPGPTYGASSLSVTVYGKRIVFSGEVLSGDGKVARLSPLQNNYNDLLGGANVYLDSQAILDAKPDFALPSLGDPVLDPALAVDNPRNPLRAFSRITTGDVFRDSIKEPDDSICEVGDYVGYPTPRVFMARNAIANTHFVQGKSGRILAIDYGYSISRLNVRPSTQHLSTRRPFLHSRRGLMEQFGSERIDAVLVSHYHDDHVNGIPMLQRLYGSEVIAGENFADILERPDRYDLPCLWHEPISVSHRAPLGQAISWDDISITLYPMSGHTRYSTLLCVEVDGVKFAHTGDQVFWTGPSGIRFGPGANLYSNHVYKNGLDIGCYLETLAQLEAFNPAYILSGHANPYPTSPEFYRALETGARDFDAFHTSLMALGESDVHFGAESQPGTLMPYRAHSRDVAPIEFEGWVMNPYASAQAALINLIVPDGWKCDAAQIALPPRGKVPFRLVVNPAADARCRRQPIGLDLVVGDRSFGIVAEALVTVGYPRF